MTILLEVKNLGVGYAGRKILPEASFCVSRGELWAIIGPNGAGKTSLLKTILGLNAKIGGSVDFKDGRCVGYVPQRSTIDESIPSRVVDLVGIGVDRGYSILDPLYIRKKRESIQSAMRDVDVLQLAKTPFQQLSEGQKQRVLMARALAANPSCLVLDEPTSAMDMVTETAILKLLKNLIQKRNVGVLMVSHNLSEIAKFATHALVVDRETQQVIQGTIQEIAHDADVERLFGNVLKLALDDAAIA